MIPAIKEALDNYAGAKSRLIHALVTTEDDRLNWSPSPTARTPIQLAAHAAKAIESITETLDGRPYPVPTIAAADAGFREWERKFSTREEVFDLLEKHSAGYLEYLEAFDPAKLASDVVMPFSLGTMPMTVALGAAPMHTDSHTAQIIYVQTIYGDHDWHIG